MGCATSTANRDGEYIVPDGQRPSISAVTKIKAHTAIKHNDAYLVERILKEVAVIENIGLPGENSTCLHVAAQFNSFLAMKTLITCLKVNKAPEIKRIFEIKNSEDQTPVTLAIINDSSETFYVLLNENVVNFNYKDAKDQSLGDLCKQYSPNCLALLEKKQGKKHVQTVKASQPNQQREKLNLRAAAPEIENIIAKVDRAHIESEEQLNSFKISSKGPEAVLQGVPTGSKLFSILTDLISSDKEFQDPDFPTQLSSILACSSHEFLSKFQNAVWKRPHELFATNYDQISLFEDIDPNDIAQGLLGDCYLLASLSATAEFPSRLAKMFINKTANKYGAYGMTFYVRGVPTEVIIDDRIPCYGDRDNMPLFSKPKGKELWVLLAEKAWAKIYGNYVVCESGLTHEALEYMLGVPAIGYNTKDCSEDEIFKILSTGDESKHIMCAGTYKETSENIGLVSAHAYSIISALSVSGHKILKLRNPWGNFEWKGDFADNSPVWTDDIKNQVGYINADDGMFYMTVRDFKQNFQTFSVGIYNDGWEYSYIEAESNPRHAEYFRFTIHRPCDVYFRIHQDDERAHVEQDPNYKYSSGDLIVTRVRDDGTFEALVESLDGYDNSSRWGARSIFSTSHHKLYLPAAGEYAIRTKLKWANEETGNFTLSAYAPYKIQLQKIGPIKGFLAEYLEGIALTGQKEDWRDGCSTVSGYHDNYYYYHFVNTNDLTWKIQINYTKFENLRLVKPYSGTTLDLIIPPKDTLTVYFKKIFPNEACATSYTYTDSLE